MCLVTEGQRGEIPLSTSAIFRDGLQSLAHLLRIYVSFPGGLDGKESPCNAGDLGSIPESEGKGNALQYSCLENPMDRGSWLATAHEFAQSWRTNQGSNVFPLPRASPWARLFHVISFTWSSMQARDMESKFSSRGRRP